MLIADSHEFIELYRGDKDLRMGMEMLKLDQDLRFVSFAPDRTSPNDRDRFGKDTLMEVGLPELPDRFDLRLLPSKSFRFARRESGGIVSWMHGYYKALAAAAPDVLLENPFSWLTPRSYQTYAYSRAHGTPIVYYDPGDDIPISFKHRVMALWEAHVIRHASAIITYNEAGKRRFINKYKCKAEQIVVIPKPVDVSALQFSGSSEGVRSTYGAQRADLVVSYVGRLAEYKGSAVLLEVARAALEIPGLERVRFVFVGDTLSSDQDRTIYHLPNTHVTGMVPHRDIPMHMAASDVVVFPDVTRPGGFPTAVAEAMAAGKAMIVGIGDHTDFLPLRHREDALLVPPSDSDAILSAVVELIQDRNASVRLGGSVGRFARENMDYPVVASRYLRILEDALNG